MALIEEGQSSGSLQLPQGFNAELMALLLWFTIHGAYILSTGLMRGFGEECDEMVKQLAAGLKRWWKQNNCFGNTS